MQTITLDFECFWSQDYTLSKMSFIEYIQDPRFEVISVSVKVNDGQTQTYWGSDVLHELARLDWGSSACVAHNGNEFDFPLLVWRFGCHPKLFIDTICLSRPRHQSEIGGSLKKLSTLYGLEEKDQAILNATRGRRLDEFSQVERVEMGRYNARDVDNTYQLLRIFLPQTPKKELKLSDMTARMICYPKLECDVDLLTRTQIALKIQKEAQLESLVDELGVLSVEDVRANLASANSFAECLRNLGVEPPTKISKTTGKPAYAFAKTDDAFNDLLEHPDERVQSLAAARLGVKSTLLETRIEKMSRCAELMRGTMPVPLAYHAATTGRWGGRVWNPQNLPRISRDKSGAIIPKLTNALRLSLRAPKGYKVVVSDLSGIELRVNHFLWQVASTMSLYAQDPQADLYKSFAAALFAKPESEITKDERQLAKVAQLGLGFGAGASTFRRVAKLMGGVELSDAEADRVTRAWRTEYLAIVQGWKACGRLVEALVLGSGFSPDPLGLVNVIGRGELRLPSGRTLYYPDLTTHHDAETGRTSHVYGTGRHRSFINGPRMDENLVQAIARDVIAEQALTIWQNYGQYPVLTVHDELVYVVPEAEADSFLASINSVMRTPPSWLPGIVLWSEGDVADSYGEAK